MGVYIFVLAFILINGLLAGQKRGWFIFSTFSLIIVIAAIRDTTVGIDLHLHYAASYEFLSTANWNEIIDFEFGGYDLGFKVLCRLLGYISTDSQFFVAFTSVVSYSAVALFLYKHSEDVVLDTLLYYASFSIFSYMTLIAQSLSIAIVLCGIDYLFKKEYKKYVLIVLFASMIHVSALVCLLFIPINILKYKRSHLLTYSALIIVILFVYDRFVNLIVGGLLPTYMIYLSGSNIHGQGNAFSLYGLYNISIYVIIILMAILFIYSKHNDDARESLRYAVAKKTTFSWRNLQITRRQATVLQVYINSNFLMYMAITSLFLYLGSFQIEVSRRFMYFTIPFAYVLLGRSLRQVNPKQRFVLRTCICVFLCMMFMYFGDAVGRNNSGVVPYAVFWK